MSVPVANDKLSNKAVETYPDQYGKLKDGSNWHKRDDVWIAYNRQWIGDVHVEMNQVGPLEPGYGGDPGQQVKLCVSL